MATKKRDVKVSFWYVVNEKGDRVALDVQSMFDRVDALKAADRRKKTNDDELVGSSWKSPVPPQRQLLIVAKVRRGATLPAIELDGVFRKIPLAKGEGIAETTHVAFYPEGVVALIGSQYGPSPTRVVGWLNLALDWAIGLEPVLRQDLQPILDNRVGEVRAFTVRVPSGALTALRQRDPGLAGAINDLTQAYGNGIDVELVIRPSGTQPATGRRNVLNTIRSLFINDGRDSNPTGMTRGQLSFLDSDTDRVDTLDLIQSKLVRTVKVAAQELDAESAIRSRAADVAIAEAWEISSWLVQKLPADSPKPIVATEPRKKTTRRTVGRIPASPPQQALPAAGDGSASGEGQ